MVFHMLNFRANDDTLHCTGQVIYVFFVQPKATGTCENMWSYY